MRFPLRLFILAVFGFIAAPLSAQMPFYTDNADVTDQGTLHFEIYSELDDLQSALYPDIRQNTANFKVNYGLPRDWFNREQGEGQEFLREATHVKNIWTPYGE
jgi:hypothetical protein